MSWWPREILISQSACSKVNIRAIPNPCSFALSPVYRVVVLLALNNASYGSLGDGKGEPMKVVRGAVIRPPNHHIGRQWDRPGGGGQVIRAVPT